MIDYTKFNDDEKRISEKVTFYFAEAIQAHISLFSGKFENCFIITDLIYSKTGATYFWIKNLRGESIRIFLRDVMDIEDLKEVKS